MELLLSVWLENWEPLYSEVPAGWCWLVGVFIRVVFLCVDVRDWRLFSLTLTHIIMWIGTCKRDCIGRPCGTTVKPGY